MNTDQDIDEKALLKKAAAEAGLPLKVVEKWHKIMNTVRDTCATTADIRWRQSGSILIYRQYELFAEVVDKGKIELIIRVGDTDLLRLHIRNSTNEHLGKVCQHVLLVIADKTPTMKLLRP